MTAANFQRALSIILQSEGGSSDNPADPGGATNLGVTLATLSNYLGRPATTDELQALTATTVTPIYEGGYWKTAACDAAPSGVDLMMFDGAVNQGPGTMVKFLQAALGLQADGIVGPMTIGAVQKCNAGEAIDQLAADRTARYRTSTGFPTFGNGWLARVARTQTTAHEWAQETI